MQTLIRDGYIMTLDDHDLVLKHGDILVQDGIIAEIGTDLDMSQCQPDEVIEAAGFLVAPGLVNADLHSQQALVRGLFENQPMEFRTWQSGLSSPDLIRLGGLLSAAEMLKSGVTSVLDHVVLQAESAFQAVDAIMQAYAQSGLHVTLAMEVKPYLSKNGKTASITNNNATKLIQLYKNLLSQWHGTSEECLRVALAPEETSLTDQEFAIWLREESSNLKIPLHFHFNQTKSQVFKARNRYQGASSIEYADILGLLNPNTSIAHAVWVTPDEIDLLARRETSVVHNPLSDLYLGSGVMPLHRFLAAGVNVGLGTGFGGGDQNLFSAMKMAASIHRIVQPFYEQWPSVEQILDMVTRAGANNDCLGGRVGKLSVGYRADLVLYDLKGLSFSPLNVLKSQFVCLENGSSVDTVLVAGKVVMRNGQLLTIDEGEALVELGRLMSQDNQLFSLQAESSLSILNEDYQRCAREPMSINRWANGPTFSSQLKDVREKVRS